MTNGERLKEGTVWDGASIRTLHILLLPSSVAHAQLPPAGRQAGNRSGRRTEVEGDRMMFSMEALSSSMVARFWCVPLLGCTGLISTRNFLGSSSSSESLDE